MSLVKFNLSRWFQTLAITLFKILIPSLHVFTSTIPHIWFETYFYFGWIITFSHLITSYDILEQHISLPNIKARKQSFTWMLSFGEDERYRWEGRPVLGWTAWRAGVVVLTWQELTGQPCLLCEEHVSIISPVATHGQICYNIKARTVSATFFVRHDSGTHPS
jgi:hypothetical protein